MNEGVKLFLLSLAGLAAAFAAERLFVPDIVPIAFAEEPQAVWAVQAAFVLRAIELMMSGAATMAFAVMFGNWARHRFASRLTSSRPTQRAG